MHLATDLDLSRHSASSEKVTAETIKLQASILAIGEDIGAYGADGRFGQDTEKGLIGIKNKLLSNPLGIPHNGVLDSQTAEAINAYLKKHPEIAARADMFAATASAKSHLVPTIVIDAGHGDGDPGAPRGDLQEAKITGDMASALKNEMETRGYNVIVTRGDPHTGSGTLANLHSRPAVAAKENADMFISLHANSTAATEQHKYSGTEVYMNDIAGKKARRFAQNIADNTSEHDARYHPVGNLGMLNPKFLGGNDRPAALVEVGYINHPEDAKRMVNPDWQKQKAAQIANGIDDYIIGKQPALHAKTQAKHQTETAKNATHLPSNVRLQVSQVQVPYTLPVPTEVKSPQGNSPSLMESVINTLSSFFHSKHADTV